MSTAEVLVPTTGESQGGFGRSRSIWKPALLLALVAQGERIVGLGVSFVSRWYLGPTELGVYSGLRMLLDNTNRSSLGVALGAIQKSIALKARGLETDSERVLAVASSTNTVTSSMYGGLLIIWGIRETLTSGEFHWGIGLSLIGALAVLKRRQDFQIAVLRSISDFSAVGQINLYRNLAFGLSATAGILLFGFWGLIGALGLSFLVERELLNRRNGNLRFPIVWDLKASLALAATGLPILAANSAWALVSTLDRALILSNLNEGTKQAGLYSIAVLGGGIIEDFASRVALVISTAYRREFGREGSLSSILVQAESTGLILLGLLAPCGLIVAMIGSAALPGIFPGLAPGVDALCPMIPGIIALCGAMPLREAWISTDRPWIPTIVTGSGALFMFIRISALGPHCTIAEVAFESSLCRILTALAMFALPTFLSKWNSDRLLRWAGISLWIAIWTAAFASYRNHWLEKFGFVQLAALSIASILATAYFVRRRKPDITSEGANRTE